MQISSTSPSMAATASLPTTAQSVSETPITMYEVQIDTTLWNLSTVEEKGRLLRAAYESIAATSPPVDGGGGGGGGGGGRGPGDIEQYVGAPGAAIGFIAGATFGGYSYIAAHGLTNGGAQASFGGFLTATLGGGFAGAVGGFSGGYGFMIASAALGAAAGAASDWVDLQNAH